MTKTKIKPVSDEKYETLLDNIRTLVSSGGDKLKKTTYTGTTALPPSRVHHLFLFNSQDITKHYLILPQLVRHGFSQHIYNN